MICGLLFECRVERGALVCVDATLPVKLRDVKRKIIALILMLAIGLQGSVAAFAATSTLMSADTARRRRIRLHRRVRVVPQANTS